MYAQAETDRGARQGGATTSSHQQKQEYQQQQQTQSKDAQFEQTKQQYQQKARTARQNANPGGPQIGVIIAGFPSPLTKELTQRCVKKGLFVSNIGVGCSGFSAKDHEVSGVSRMEIIDCQTPGALDHLERARDALEKEGSEVVIVLDVGQDCRSIDLYNKLKIPFVHSGSSEWSDEIKMYDEVTAAENHCVISPFISREAGLVQLNFEHFARMNPGIFRDWKLTLSDSWAEGNAVGAKKRRTLNALSFLVDKDPSGLSNYAPGETGPLGYPGLQAQQGGQQLQEGQPGYEQQQQQTRGQAGYDQQQGQGYEQQQQRSTQQSSEKESTSSSSAGGGGGLLSKLGLGTTGGQQHKEQHGQTQTSQQTSHQEGGDKSSQQQESSSSSSGGGLMAKLGLGGSGSGAASGKQEGSSMAQSAKAAIMGTATTNCKSSFTVRSPDGMSSFTMGSETNGTGDVESILCMADYLGCKIVHGRKPRVWGLKDWVPGMNDVYREIAEYVQEKGFVQERSTTGRVQTTQTKQQQEYRAPREPTGHSVQHQREGNISDTTQNYPGTSGDNTLGERGQQQRLYERQGQEQYEQQGQTGHPAGSGTTNPTGGGVQASMTGRGVESTTQQQHEQHHKQGGGGLTGAIASAFGLSGSSKDDEQEQGAQQGATSQQKQGTSSTSQQTSGSTSTTQQQSR